MEEVSSLRTAGKEDVKVDGAKIKFTDLQKLRTIGTGGFGTVNLVRHKVADI